MVNKIDLTNKLTVLRYIGKSGIHIQYECICTCGKILKVFASNLRSGNTNGCQSCAKTKHGWSKHKFYRRLCSLNRRRLLSNTWKDISIFIRDVESSYEDGAYLRRKDITKPHSFKNSF